MSQSVKLVRSGSLYGLRYSVRRCISCFLSDRFPDIHFDADDVCSYCRDPRLANSIHSSPESIVEVRERIQNRHGSIDIVHMFSGGKDSTFALSLLVLAGFRVRAMTYDNGFIAPETFRNIERTADILGVECVTRRLDPDSTLLMIREGLIGHDNADALKYATATCGLCISTVLSFGAAEAKAVGVGYISGGWTPGQFTYDSIVPPSFLADVCNGHFDALSLRNPSLRGKLISTGLTTACFPTLFNPLYVTDYHEQMVRDHLAKVGWKLPAQMDSCSSNCLLNGYLVLEHALRHGFHPYEFELAHHVRTGRLSRHEALAKIEDVAVPVTIVQEISRRLGLPPLENAELT